MLHDIVPQRKLTKPANREQCSSGGPFHVAAAQYMNVNMAHRLAPIDSLIQHQPVAGLGKPELLGYLDGEPDEVPSGRLLGLEVRRAIQVLQRNRKDVSGSLRADVMKCERAIRPLHDLGRNLSRDDPAKQAITHPNLLGR